ncbi:hypothetical protein DBV15_10331 [Temnothorax longispinosus]|uniref:Uncharacterized protein n=1 Tax=Temnothorax longispinosus TaxID=300112 RepID=A0A4S2L2U8_9HYME|nr:hypothetical protein DBV15_10331 [Temnothorax longispinosus]
MAGYKQCLYLHRQFLRKSYVPKRRNESSLRRNNHGSREALVIFNNFAIAGSFLSRTSVLRDGYNGTEKKTQQVVELFRRIETFAGKVRNL